MPRDATLPTPDASVANDGKGPDTWLARREKVKNGRGMPLTIAVQLLKTPTAQLGVNGGSQHPAKRKAGGHGPTLAGEVEHLLPTPRAADHTHSMTAPAAMKHVEDGNGSLAETLGYHLLPTPMTSDTQHPAPVDMRRKSPGLRAVESLLPTPKAGDAEFGMPRTSGRPPEKSTHLMTRMEYGKPESSWGPYAAAIERWEIVLGRPAPDPTEAGPKGGRRLSAAFVEWLMGLPEEWVTAPERGLSRTQQLKMLGNGVVPQQALYALRLAEVAG